MKDTLKDLLGRQGPLSVLQAFGLEQMLTDEDDPWLWACVLADYWHAPWDSEIEPGTLRFGLGRTATRGGETVSRSGMIQIEQWCFKRLDEAHLKVASCPDFSGATNAEMVARENLSGRDYLDISRPSNQQKRAVVHKGISMPPKAGSGETYYWEKTEGGPWVQTEELFSRWIA